MAIQTAATTWGFSSKNFAHSFVRSAKAVISSIDGIKVGYSRSSGFFFVLRQFEPPMISSPHFSPIAGIELFACLRPTYCGCITPQFGEGRKVASPRKISADPTQIWSINSSNCDSILNFLTESTFMRIIFHRSKLKQSHRSLVVGVNRYG